MPRSIVIAALAIAMSATAHAACASRLVEDEEARITYAVTKCEMKPEQIAYFIMARMRAVNPLTRRFQDRMPSLPPAIPPREVQ